ncbi:helix-turn-helix domain-containing protein [Parabacteroides sp. PF5-9]|uniref:winged helix-turn-helix transcriptional regulator n=1 Tax=Parabacteroides sp. PF5-9 TaxID=1742404 RepID=UPI0024733C41|nr:helix-turn-helix domain-containing protein [Parabacteroides sp. PF5-9]MDH6357520.1 DNA-binding HxlR family transcriptional regulator [Parabacteroides sp. PF5-9]
METKKLIEFQTIDSCPIRNVLSRLGDKWSILVLIMLQANGTLRFNDLHRRISDISQRMLTVTLRSLETDGLVYRQAYAEIPPRVEYSLTEMGEGLLPHIQALVDWAAEHMPLIIEKREEYTD